MLVTYITLNDKEVPPYDTKLGSIEIFDFGARINTFLNSNFSIFKFFGFDS
jgi:hypothetical protein